MKVFVFDLLPYGEDLDRFKNGGPNLPWPLGKSAFDPSMNRGAMPHEMFINQINRFAAEVLPALKAHKVTRVPLAEEAAAAQ